MNNRNFNGKIPKKFRFCFSLIAILCMFVFCSCGDADSDDGNINATTMEPVQTVFEKNQIVRVDNISICVLNVDSTKTISSIGSGFTTQNSFLIVKVRLTNYLNSDKMISSGDFKAKYNSVKYDSLPTESYWYGYNNDAEGLSYMQFVKAGLSLEVYLVFEVPASHTIANYNLKFKPVNTAIEIKLYGSLKIK